MKLHKELKWGAGLLIPLILACTASAVQITHSTMGTLFDDTFENQDVDGTPPETADMTPGGNGGDGWVATNDTTTLAIETLTDATAPGSNEGNQYARLDNLGDRLDAVHSFVASGVLTIRFAAYIPSAALGGGSRIRMRLRTGGDVSTEIIWFTNGDDEIHTSAGGATGLTFVPDQWQNYTVVYDYNQTGGGAPDDDTVSISIDGHTASGLDTGPASPNTTIDTVDWRLIQSGNAQLLLDAQRPPVVFSPVPQPDTVSMCFTSDMDNVYTLQATTDLLNPGLWENVGANITGNGNAMYLFDIDPAPASKAYRIVGE